MGPLAVMYPVDIVWCQQLGTIALPFFPAQAVTGFSLQLPYNSTRFSFVGARSSSMWSDLAAFTLPDTTNIEQLWLTALTPTGLASTYVTATDPCTCHCCSILSTHKLIKITSPLLSCRYTGAEIALADAYFAAKDTILPASSTSSNPTPFPFMEVAPSSSIYPYAGRPRITFLDYTTDASGGTPAASTPSNITGTMRVVPVQTLAVLPQLQNHELFNTAVLDGQDVTAAVEVSCSPLAPSRPHPLCSQ